MKYIVTAMCVHPVTGDIIAPAREESIDTEDNELFAECEHPWEVEDAYHSFWNRLNYRSADDAYRLHVGKVVVLNVKEGS